ncbi:hypothetical protein TNCV_3809321 [Trichonephila clavipes]|nr:hypothetical protein TNCV_3809321 [Trichonephila clavipes]
MSKKSKSLSKEYDLLTLTSIIAWHIACSCVLDGYPHFLESPNSMLHEGVCVALHKTKLEPIVHKTDTLGAKRFFLIELSPVNESECGAPSASSSQCLYTLKHVKHIFTFSFTSANGRKTCPFFLP